MDHLGLVVDDLEAATAFFVELGMDLGTEARARPPPPPATPRASAHQGAAAGVAPAHTPAERARIPRVRSLPKRPVACPTMPSPSCLAHATVTRRWLTSLLLLALLAACNSSDDGTPAPDGSSPVTGAAAEPGEYVETADAYWQPPISIADATFDVDNVVLRAIDGDLWALVERLNGAAVYRSGDGGRTWTIVDVTPPPAEGALPLHDIVRQQGGRYLISGTIESRCGSDYEVADGFRDAGNCTGYRPVMFVSDDGASWRRVEPPAMAPPGDSSVVVAGIAASANGFLAAGTVRADDWHARLWSSPDGEDWILERELRDGDLATSAAQILTDGDDIVVLAYAHPCAMPWPGSPVGWVLGTASIDHVRIFEGATPSGVTLRGRGDHPLAVAPADVDCDDSVITLRGVPYPRIVGALVDGQITLVRTPPQHEKYAEDTDERTGMVEPHPIARRVNGAWQESQADGFAAVEPGIATPVLRWVVDVHGQPGLVFERPHERSDRTRELFVVLPEGDGNWSRAKIGHPLISTGVGGAAWADGGLVLAAQLALDPYDPRPEASFIASNVFATRLLQVSAGATGACDLTAGGRCQFADLSLVEGYPGFEGRDLSAIDLAFSNLGEANFDGSNLAGARMWQVAAADASFVEADLSGALLQRAELGDVTEANLAGANLRSTELIAVDGARLDGVFIDGTELVFARRPEIPAEGWVGSEITWRYDEAGDEPYELSLAGVDLTDTAIRGRRNGGLLLRITDLSGTTLTGASFYHVDLTAIDPTSVDLSDVRFWETSLCPDGDPPDDSPIGSCLR